MAKTPPRSRLRSFARHNGGAVAIEYGLLLMMVGVALVGMASLSDVSNHLNNAFDLLANTIKGN